MLVRPLDFGWELQAYSANVLALMHQEEDVRKISDDTRHHFVVLLVTSALVVGVTVLFCIPTAFNFGLSLSSNVTLPKLLKFIRADGKVVNIPEEIATNYVQFGAFLLDDEKGVRVNNIAHRSPNDAERINTEILKEWLIGRGKKPVTWATLVDVLHDIKLSTLARDIETVKCPASKEPS